MTPARARHTSVFGFGKKRPSDAGAPAPGPERSLSTKVLPKFLAALRNRPSAVVLDLGPVVGANVSFLGEQLGCKIYVEDVFSDLQRATREGTLATLGERLAGRFQQPDGSIDGILAWDLFDYLDRSTSQALGAQLARVLAPGGALVGFFAQKMTTEPSFTRFVIEDERTLIHRPYQGVPPNAKAWQNRDVAMLFPGLRVAESFLLLTQTREILFRKG